MLFIGNIILWNVFLDSLEEGVDRYSATGKPICLLFDVNINTLRAQTLDFLQSSALFPTNDKLRECTIIQQHLWTIFLQIRSANTLPVGELSLITFPNSTSFNLLLKQLSLSKLVLKTTQNTLSRDS